MDENEDYYEEDIQEYKISLESNLSAEQVGTFIISISSMYRVVKDYLGSTHELKLVNYHKGSDIFHFLADSNTWDLTVTLWKKLTNEALYVWGLVQGNFYWDVAKYTVLKKYTNNQMTNEEESQFIHSASNTFQIAISQGSSIKVETKDNEVKVILTYSKEMLNEILKLKVSIEQKIESQNSNSSFPPRRITHKKKKK